MVYEKIIKIRMLIYAAFVDSKECLKEWIGI